MADDFRVAVIGQAAFGESVLNALIEGGDNIVGVFCSPDREGRPVDPIKAAAEKHGIPVFQFRRMRNQDAIDAFLGLNSDLCVMAFVTDIVPDAMLEAPKHGTIQYHPSLLPKHRGPSSINWPIIQGDSKTGLSIFWPDKGLDTGPVLLQKETEIGPDDTLGSVYFDRLFPMGVEAMVESVQMVKDGAAPKIVQDDSQATYEGWCRADDAIIDWSKPIGEVYNLVRGADPSPGAGTTFKGSKIQFFRAGKNDGDTGKSPGEIVGVTDSSFEVAADGGSIVVGRVQPEGARKIMASEWMESVSLKVGDKFGD
ncbi:MAG: methionyl-tRNA formyltransferase [Chloroflexi bacterium]|nr:methionyl-tRNA formyltransferase [Chloroflexota bacterium]MCI0821834.1 methionyl-tRNA formyltransferase [Chloroflexota bacterium]MCI0868480.1 methionyl-tRNA formyltransferase [Chloroflexota bacterium]